MIGTGFIGASFGDRLGAFHHKCTTFLPVFIVALISTETARWFGFNGVLTVGVIGTAVEYSEAATTFCHFTFIADGALYTSCYLGSIFVLFDKFAFWIIVAGNK